MEQFFYFLYKTILRQKVFFSILFLVLLSTAGFYAFKLQLSEDVSKLLPEKDIPENLIENLNAIDFADKLFFHLQLTDTTQVNPDELLQAADTFLARVQPAGKDLIARVQYKTSSTSIDQVYNLILNNLPYYLEDADYANIETLLEPQKLEASFAKKYKTLFSPAGAFMRKMITRDPVGISLGPLMRLQTFQFDTNFNLYKQAIFTSDKKHLLFYLEPAFKSSDSKHNGALIKLLEREKNKVQQEFNGQLTLNYFGAPAVAYANAEQIKSDVILTVIIALIAIILFVALFYRRKRLFVIIFIPAGLAVLSAMAIMYLLKGEVSAIALGMGSILVGISIDYVLHIFTHAQNGHSVKSIYRDVSSPILISALTTSAAFLGLLAISSEALRDMGLFAGISILFAALFSLILIPLFLPDFKTEKSVDSAFRKKLLPLFSFPFHKQKWLILAILLLSPVLYYFSGKVQFNGDLNAINYMPENLKKAENQLNKISSVSQRNVFLLSRASTLDSALQQSEKIQASLLNLKAQGIDIQVAQIQNLLPSTRLQKERLTRWNAFWTPNRIEQLLHALQSIQKQYGFKPDAFDSFEQMLQKQYLPLSESDIHFVQTNLLGEFIKHKQNDYSVITQIKVPLAQKAELHQLLEETPYANDVLDKEFLASRFLRALQSDFHVLVVITMLLIFLIILLSFGRIELALITFIPMSLSWMWTLGIMALFGMTFNIVNIIISTLIFGLGIDYSIFITRGLIKEYSTGEKVLTSFKTSIFFSSLTTIFGIGVLVFAQHPALKSMAIVTVVGLVSVLLIAFTIQPWLFYLMVNTSGDKKRVLPITFTNLFASVLAFTFFLIGTLFSTLAGFVLLPFGSEKMRVLFHRIIQWNSKAILYIMFHVPKKVIGNSKEKFKNPAVVISNHQSHIDIVLLLMLHPKMIILTNDWVQRNPFYGILVKMAQFYPVLDRLEENLPLIRQKVEKGYSIMVFPEGSRSPDSQIKRFHKGAFYIAQQLNLDVLPVILHGVGDCITKGENFLKRGKITVKVLSRIPQSDTHYGETYVTRSKAFRQMYLREFEKLRLEVETPEYFRYRLINNYLHKGPVLEWYTKIKTRFDGNYALFHKLLPRKAVITDIGCGYGMMDYMLHFLSAERQIVGIDYDEDKIAVASNVHAASYATKNQLCFMAGDAATVDLPLSDAFILSDVLHYLPFDEQEKLLQRGIEHLNVNGQIIIRDADSEHKKHKGTRFSEWQSTRLIGFNKTRTADKQLYFTSAKRLTAFFESRGFSLEIIDNTKLNSNLIYIARKK